MIGLVNARDSAPSRRAILGLVVAFALAEGVALVWAVGELLESIAAADGLAAWDRPVLDWAIAHRSPSLTAVVAAFSDAGGPVWQPLITVAVVAILWWRLRDPGIVVLTAIAAAGSLVMTLLGKPAFERARPPLSDAVPPYETSFSFPSGHSLNALVIAGILAYLVVGRLRSRGARWAAGFGFAVYAVAMGLSRVFLGHHWFTDVVGAWMIGIGWLAVVIACHRGWRAVGYRA